MAADTQTSTDLNTDYSLGKEQIAEYQDKGHILLRGLASRDEIAEYEPLIVAAADRFRTENRPLAERDTYGQAFLQIENLWVRDEAVRRFTLAKRFGKVAAELMGVSGARIYHDQALFKEPGGGPTPWHQDQFYWPINSDNTITMWMPLVDIPAVVGSMTFGSGSHKLGYLGDLPISDKSQIELENFISSKGIEKQWYGAMSAGDATFHAGWTLHSAPNNPTANMREVMTIIYVADGVPVAEPVNQNQKNDLGNWFRGLKPGDIAAGELNPLAYSSLD